MEIFQDLEDMEVDTYEQIPDWTAIRLYERKDLVEELDHEGPIYFEGDSVTLRCISYQKDTRKILL